MVSDYIADMLTRIRNANTMKYKSVTVLGSKMILGIAEILKKEGYITGYKYNKDIKGDTIDIELKYGAKKERVIIGLKRISKPGLRVYAKSDELPHVLNNLGIAIISTSEGLLTDAEARAKGLGGEVLAYIW
jgi:small subunit ribosomal protein S8